MNDEQEVGGERNSYGCSAADYDIHSYKYNRVLFHNMMGFMDLCLEIDVISKKAIPEIASVNKNKHGPPKVSTPAMMITNTMELISLVLNIRYSSSIFPNRRFLEL